MLWVYGKKITIWYDLSKLFVFLKSFFVVGQHHQNMLLAHDSASVIWIKLRQVHARCHVCNQKTLQLSKLIVYEEDNHSEKNDKSKHVH